MAKNDQLTKLKEILGHDEPTKRRLSTSVYRVCKKYTNAFEYAKKRKEINDINRTAEKESVDNDGQ